MSFGLLGGSPLAKRSALVEPSIAPSEMDLVGVLGEKLVGSGPTQISLAHSSRVTGEAKIDVAARETRERIVMKERILV